MFKISDRVKESSSSTGTGAVALDGAYGGFQTFLAGIGDGNTTYYTIENFYRWEVGIGTYTQSTNSLSRDTVLRSSSGQDKISLDGASIVFCTLAADRTFIKDSSNNIGGIGGVFAESGIFDDLIVTDDLSLEAGSLSTSDYILSSGLLTLVNTDDEGCFIHAYRDDVSDKTVALHVNSNSSPLWKFGLKSTPDSKLDPPDHGYVYGVDGAAGIVSNNNNYTEMSSSAGLFTYHDSHTLLRASSATGVYIDGKTSSYPILTVQGAAGQAEDLQRWENSSSVILAKVKNDGSISGALETHIITFPDGTTQTTAFQRGHADATDPSNVLTIDCSLSNYFEITHNSNALTAVEFENASEGQSIILKIRNGYYTGSMSSYWDDVTINGDSNGVVHWPSSSEPAVTSGMSDLYGIVFSGDVKIAYGYVIGQNYAV